jgi:hypothetical protein
LRGFLGAAAFLAAGLRAGFFLGSNATGAGSGLDGGAITAGSAAGMSLRMAIRFLSQLNMISPNLTAFRIFS